VKLVIVESGAKAKKIQGFLGKEYHVEACVGHVRDLESKSVGIDVENGFAPTYVVTKPDVVKLLQRQLKKADELLLATDPDREGEAIAWHLAEVLQPSVPIVRIVFTEITEPAVLEALAAPRAIDLALVKAQEVRRFSDRLIGYLLSPLLFQNRAVPQATAVGRVQSPALRLIVEREYERRYFKAASYWGLAVDFRIGDETYTGTLVSLGGQRIASSRDFDPDTGQLRAPNQVVLVEADQVARLVEVLQGQPATVLSVKHRERESLPKEPFRTVTLQAAAASQLSWSTARTSRVAQRLYENGHITYIRTDSVMLSAEAIGTARAIAAAFGPAYVPATPPVFKGAEGPAQEAHEAIRPAGDQWLAAADKDLPEAEGKLYDLIYRRTVASQMAPARIETTTVEVGCGEAVYRIRCQRTLFDGHRALLTSEDDEEVADQARPEAEEGRVVPFVEAEPLERTTKPPNRFTDSRLISRLEDEGVGRPSTYGAIINGIVNHGYVRKHGRTLIPTLVGMGLIRFLESELAQYIDLQFTARMEQDLDRVATGEVEATRLLARLYEHLAVRREAILEDVDAVRVRQLPFDDLDPSVRVMLGRYGPYLEGEVHARNRAVPPEVAPAELTLPVATALLDGANGEPYAVDIGPGEVAWVRFGAYGPYLELDGGHRRTASVPTEIPPTNVTPDIARKLLHPIAEKGDTKIYLCYKKNWYLQWVDMDGERRTRTVPPSLDPLQMTVEQVWSLYQMPRDLGTHPDTGGIVQLDWGRGGPYVRHKVEGKKADVGVIEGEMAEDWHDLTLEDAVEALRPRLDPG
jgi:DNA topoisomerase-1|tara:strand:+ start:146 stop:2566 length:2421 start_codon:yes stop_codon:yes gene_type:complete